MSNVRPFVFHSVGSAQLAPSASGSQLTTRCFGHLAYVLADSGPLASSTSNLRLAARGFGRSPTDVPPVYMTFGSMISGSNESHVIALFTDAAQAADVRAVIQVRGEFNHQLRQSSARE